MRVLLAVVAIVLCLQGEALAAAGPVSIVWGGDVTLGSSYGMPPDRGRPQLTWVAGTLARADIGAVNYEGTFAPGGASKCGAGAADCFAFQAPAVNARTLAGAGVDIVNTANTTRGTSARPAGARRAPRSAGPA
jgi:hypothetical protein